MESESEKISSNEALRERHYQSEYELFLCYPDRGTSSVAGFFQLTPFNELLLTRLNDFVNPEVSCTCIRTNELR